VLIGGVRAPITDLVGPGWSCVDVSGAPNAYVGAEATLIGRQANEQVTVEEIASQRNCGSDDVIASLPASLSRRYVH
jgi:alanine racemase